MQMHIIMVKAMADGNPGVTIRGGEKTLILILSALANPAEAQKIVFQTVNYFEGLLVTDLKISFLDNSVPSINK